MKFLTLLFACCVLASTPVFTGCGTTQTTEAKRFNSFRDVYAVTRAAYDGFCVRVVQGKVTRPDEARADRAWNQYRASFKLAFKSASLDWQSAAPADVQKLGEELVVLLNSFGL